MPIKPREVRAIMKPGSNKNPALLHKLIDSMIEEGKKAAEENKPKDNYMNTLLRKYGRNK